MSEINHEQLRAQLFLKRMLQAILLLILGTVVSLIFLESKIATIVVSILGANILYNYIRFKISAKKSRAFHIEKEKAAGTYVDANEITWCKNCIHFRENKNWQNESIWFSDTNPTEDQIPCAIIAESMETWEMYFSLKKEKRSLYPKNCLKYIKK